MIRSNMAFNGEIFEIMSWLPVKPLYKLSTMAKLSMEFLSEPFFREKQSRNSCMRSEESLIIQEDSCTRTRVKKLCFCFLPENHRSIIGIPRDSVEFLANKGRIIASSNGLVLCRTINSDKPTKLFLCNPATRTWLPIKLPSKELALKFRYTGDFKIALVCGNVFGNKNEFPLDFTILFFTPHDIEWGSGYDVYMFEKGKWVLKKENLMMGGGFLNFDEQVCCKDGLYLLSDFGSRYVFHYDVENQTSNIITLPHDREAHEDFDSLNCRFRLLGWERKKGNSWFDSICLVKSFDYLITIWVLEDTTTKEKTSSSWRRLLSIHIEEHLDVEYSRWTNSFTILEKYLVFGDSKGNIYRYCLDGKNYGKPDLICKYGYYHSAKLRFNSYTTSLRPCSEDLNKPLKIKLS